MKTIRIIVTILAFFPVFAMGQECIFFYPEMEGAELTYQNYDKKGEITGSYFQKVTSYKKTTNGAEATIFFKTFDKKDKPVTEATLEVACEEGIFYFDMRGFINQQMISAYEDMEISVETENLEMPGKMNVGDVLKDGFLTMDISSSGMKIMTMKITISDRKVETKESVTTRAGTYDCFKISSVTTTKSPMKMVINSTEWFSVGTGLVKSESYSGSGKFMGKSELIDLKR